MVEKDIIFSSFLWPSSTERLPKTTSALACPLVLCFCFDNGLSYYARVAAKSTISKGPKSVVRSRMYVCTRMRSLGITKS